MLAKIRNISRRWAIVLATLAIALCAAMAFVAYVTLSKDSSVRDDGVLQAAIIDQLSLYAPNEQFLQGTTALLEGAGYSVDYYGGHDVTVDLYRDLPTKRYDVIVIRGHSGISKKVDPQTGAISDEEYVSLSTGELYYRYLHVEEQSKGLLGESVVQAGTPPVFGFGYDFVKKAMHGNFSGGVVIMMGCDGLRTRDTAQAFLDRGASAFVSWSQPVSTYQTDRATQILVGKLLADSMDATEAVTQTAAEVGPDPWYGGELRILN